jgi:hypothetical protein
VIAGELAARMQSEDSMRLITRLAPSAVIEADETRHAPG